MNWDAIAAIGEVVGATGVIFSLIYLGIQIRTQNKEAKRATINVLVEQWNQFMASVAEHQEVASVWVRGVKGEPLNDIDMARYMAFTGRFFRIMEGLYLQHLDGRLDARIWTGATRTLDDVIATPGARDFWQRRAHWYSDEFNTHINERLKAPGLNPEVWYRKKE